MGDTREGRVSLSNLKGDPTGGLTVGREQNGLTSLHLLAVLRHVIWADGAQEFITILKLLYMYARSEQISKWLVDSQVSHYQ